MRRFGIGCVALGLLSWASMARADLTKIDGRAVDASGRPVADAEVSSSWNFRGGKPKANAGIRADADGHFHYEDEFHGRPGVVIAIDAEHRTGGMTIVEPGKLPRSVEITMTPLVRVHGRFTCQALGKPLGWINVLMMTGPTNIVVAQAPSREATLDLTLPVGRYNLNAYGTEEVQAMGRKIELRADQPDLDLGTIDLAVSPLGKMYGKEASPLHVTDARGIGKDIKLSDFRGKWVVLDFWGYWCGPCVGRSLPDLMQIWDEHPDDRDKFVVLAFHDKRAENFAQLDEKLAPIVRDTWHGRELPFPILLDATGRTVEEYGILSWPTTVLINPEGIVVPGGEYTLRKVLPEVPIPRRIPLALDKSVGFGLTDGIKLGDFAKSMGQFADIPIKLDEPALRAAGVAPDAQIPLNLAGQLSLRGWLALGLRPLGLVAAPGPEGLIVTTPSPAIPAAPEPTPAQARTNAKIGRKLAETKVSFDFDHKTLAEAASFFEQQTGENFVLDPADRLGGRLDPKMTVAGKATDAPLGEALKSLLGPLGIEAVVRDEVVVLSRPARP